MLDTGLADRIRSKGVRVVEVAGWETRSAGSYEPHGSVNHHTAGGTRGSVPSLATVIYGRPDVPGPLAQVLQSREPDGGDVAYVICAGRSNNAGKGSWKGITGNSRVGGLEVEHTGTGPVDPKRLEISARIQAALLEAPDSSRDASLCCQHFEWTSRKIDFHDLTPWTPASFRARVAYWIGRSAEEGTDMSAEDIAEIKAELDRVLRSLTRIENEPLRPTVDAVQEIVAADNDDADILVKGDGEGVPASHGARWYALGALGKRHITSRDEADALLFAGKLRARPGTTEPFVWRQSVVDAIDDVATAPEPA